MGLDQIIDCESLICSVEDLLIHSLAIFESDRIVSQSLCVAMDRSKIDLHLDRHSLDEWFGVSDLLDNQMLLRFVPVSIDNCFDIQRDVLHLPHIWPWESIARPSQNNTRRFNHRDMLESDRPCIDRRDRIDRVLDQP
jgi:hypothetical protein